jgi:hypothetical protein
MVIISYLRYNVSSSLFVSVSTWLSVERILTAKMNKFVLFLFMSRDSSVGIALGYRLDNRGSRVRFPAGAGIFFLHHRVQNGSGGPPSLLSNECQVLFPWGGGGGRPGCEADHSPPSSAEVKE